MKKECSILIFLSFIECYSWSSASHKGMTRHAMKEILKISGGPTTTDTVHVKYNMMIDFFQTMFKGMGAGADGILFSAIGAMADLGVSQDRFNIDTVMTYSNMQEADIIAQAGRDPDGFDDKTGIFGAGNCLVGHMYAPTGLGFADYMVDYFYKKAVATYKKGQTLRALIYLAYATNYYADVAIPVHAEADFLNQKNIKAQWSVHSKIEDWIANNWTLFDTTAAEAACAPLPVCDIKAGVRSLGLETYQKVSEWYKAWDVTKSDPTTPKYQSEFKDLVKEQVWKATPRISGLLLKFKKEVNYGPIIVYKVLPMKKKK
jgi:hypothetical protein